MANKLYNILVPIDFTTRNKWAIAKAIELANSLHCNIHLVYVNRSANSLLGRNINNEAVFKKLEQVKTLYKNQLCGEGDVEISVLQGNVQKQLLNYIE